MDWILENLENVVVPIIILILYGLGSVAQKKDNKDKQGKAGPVTEADPDEARRVREIQEEIRRKIAERTGRTPPPPIRKSPVSERERPPAIPNYRESRKQAPKSFRKFPSAKRQPPPPPARPPAFPTETHQREIEAKLRKVKELEAKVKTKKIRSIDHSWDIRQHRPDPSSSELRKQLFKDLAQPLGQRKAILLSEILGRPVGIKGPADWKSNV